MLPTDELIIKATTLTSNVQAIIPQLWAAKLEKNLRKLAILQTDLIVNTDLLAPNAGDTIYIPILPDLAAAVSLTEGTDMTPIALNNASSVALVPTEYGLVVEISRKALDRMKYDGVAEIVDRLGYAMAQTVEQNIAALWNASVPGTANKMDATTYPNGKVSTNITAADSFNDKMILDAIKILENANNIPFEDGMFHLYISPGQWNALLQDTNTRQDLHWAEPMRLIDGTVGSGSLGGGVALTGNAYAYRGNLHGVKIHVTNYLKTATENGQTVTKALMLAPRWAAIAWKRRPEVVVDPTLYDMGRRRRFGVTADFDIQLIHNERGCVLSSV